MVRLFNTLTRKVEELRPINRGKVGVYICGPTVYDYAHIGHARTYVSSDVLVRALGYLDYETQVVMNITDVGHLTSDADTGEDKMEKKAAEEAKPILEIAEFYTQDFWEMAGKLNIGKPNVICKATEHIEEMVALVKELERKGFTYTTEDGVYFDTSKLKDYGKLARLDVKGLKEGARVKKDPNKKNPTDFALWKVAKADEKRQLEWESPWGKHSFPGWHIECSAMAMKYLGATFDIHTGGIDHIPVHHTNEIAQSEAATGKPFVKHWFHSGHLMIEGEKMSKSKKNFYRLSDLEKKGYEPLAFRYLTLTAQYRTTMNFTWAAMDVAQKAFERLKESVADFKGEQGRVALSEEKLAKVEIFRKKFLDAVANDLSMPEAMAVVWEVVKSNIPGEDKYDLLVDFDKVLGLDLRKAESVERRAEVPDEVQELVDKRERARREERFERADKLRKEIEQKGYLLEDNKAGTKVRKA